MKKPIIEKEMAPSHIEVLQSVLQEFPELELREKPTNEPKPSRKSYIIDAPTPGERDEYTQKVIDFLGEDNIERTHQNIVYVPDTGLQLLIKPPYGKKASGGKSRALTDDFETATMLACLYYVELGTLLDTEEAITEVYPNAPTDDKWLKTYVNTPMVLKEWLGGETGYSYHHAKGGVYTSEGERSEGIPNLHALISSFFRPLGLKNVNAWNPADMYICKEGKEHEYYSKLQDAVTGGFDPTNEVLREGANSKDLVGVSLKQMPVRKDPQEYNIVKNPHRESDFEVLNLKNFFVKKSPEMLIKTPDGRALRLYFKDSRPGEATIYPEGQYATGSSAKTGRLPIDMIKSAMKQYGMSLTHKDDINAKIRQNPDELREYILQLAATVQNHFPDIFHGEEKEPPLTLSAVAEYTDVIMERASSNLKKLDKMVKGGNQVADRILRNTLNGLEAVTAAVYADQKGELNKLLGNWVYSGKKSGDIFAPFIKLGEAFKVPEDRLYKLFEASKENVNLHMTHVDEAHILLGHQGAQKALEALSVGYNKLVQRENVNFNVKWDGAPAVYVGWLRPEDIGRDDWDKDKIFGVALKALFAKNPKVITSKSDIDHYYEDRGDLNTKIHELWDALKGHEKAIPQDQVWQGDFLFGGDDVVETTIDEEDYLTFQPNTIMYAVKKDSEIGKEIDKADVGVVWHTRYTGDSLDKLKASYNIYQDDIRKLDYIPNLWSTIVHGDYEGEPILGESEKQQFNSYKSRAEILVGNLAQYDQMYETMRETNKGAFVTQFNAMINEHVKNGELNNLNPKTAYDDFLAYLGRKYRGKMERLSSQGKKARPAEREWERVLEAMAVLQDEEAVKEILRILVALQKAFNAMKMIIVEGMNYVASGGGVIRTYLKRRGGYLEPASHEGFVIQDKSGNPYKFVDRTQFARANFSDEYVKGWEH